MKLKTFLYVLLGFLAFFGIVALFYANRVILGQRFIVWPERFLPLYAVLFIAFLLLRASAAGTGCSAAA